jgi:hypothetical protein
LNEKARGSALTPVALKTSPSNLSTASAPKLIDEALIVNHASPAA